MQFSLSDSFLSYGILLHGMPLCMRVWGYGRSELQIKGGTEDQSVIIDNFSYFSMETSVVIPH